MILNLIPTSNGGGLVTRLRMMADTATMKIKPGKRTTLPPKKRKRGMWGMPPLPNTGNDAGDGDDASLLRVLLLMIGKKSGNGGSSGAFS